MFDIGAQEILLIVVVAILVIGPKDMPAALRVAGRWIGKMRRVSGHFRTGLDAMVREAEMEEMEKKWKAQNEKIMREHPQGSPDEMEPTGAYPPRRLPPEPGSDAETPGQHSAHATGAEAAMARSGDKTDEPELQFESESPADSEPQPESQPQSQPQWQPESQPQSRPESQPGRAPKA